MADRPSWQGHLRLSLVTCPVILYNAISPRGDVHFNLINPDTGNRIRMLTVDAGTEEPVQRRDLVKGFEISKGEYVIVTPEEIESVRLESNRTIDIDSFVPANEIDRLYWDHPYYLVPDGKMAFESFAVIRQAMEKSGKVALGRVVMAQRERLLALEPRDHGIVATTLRHHDEVRAADSYFDDIPNTRPDKEMIAIAEKIIAQKDADFDPNTFEDRYEDALRDLIKQKEKGHKIVRPEEPANTGNVVDLMEALRASLKQKGGGASKSAAKSAPRARVTKAANSNNPKRKAANSNKPQGKKAVPRKTARKRA